MITLHSEQTGKVTLKPFPGRMGVFVEETGYNVNDLPADAVLYKRVHQAVPAAEAVQGGGAQAAAAPAVAAAAPAVAAAALREQALVAAGSSSSSSSSSSDDDDDLAGGSSLRPGARKWGYAR